MRKLRNYIESALTKTEYRKMGRGKKVKRVELPPSERLVMGIQFAFFALALLTVLELAYLFMLKTWSNEVFAAITGLIGTITGVFLTAR